MNNSRSGNILLYVLALIIAVMAGAWFHYFLSVPITESVLCFIILTAILMCAQARIR